MSCDSGCDLCLCACSYAFQLLAQLLGLHASREGTAVPEQYMAILPIILMPVFWERPGYPPAMAPLLVGYLRSSAAHLVANEQLQPMLGVFQKLVSRKANDTCVFSI